MAQYILRMILSFAVRSHLYLMSVLPSNKEMSTLWIFAHSVKVSLKWHREAHLTAAGHQ